MTLSILFIIAIMSSLFHYVLRTNVFSYIVIICGILLFIYYMSMKSKKYVIILIILSLFTTLYLSKHLYYQSTGDLLSYFLLIAQIGLGIFIFESSSAIKLLRYIYILIILSLLFYYFSGTNPHHISKESSANIVNYIFLCFSLLVTGVYYREFSKITIIPAMLSVLVSIWSLGRAGIITSVIFFAGIFLIKFKSKLNKFTVGITILVSALSIYTIYNYLNYISLRFLYSNQGNTFIKGSERSLIIDSYFDQLNIERLLYGVNYQQQHFFAGYSNIHNSYLSFHAKFGLAGIIVLIGLLLVLFNFFITKQYVYLVLFLSLLLRGSTDSVMLVGMYDYVLIYFLIICLERINRKKYSKKIIL